MKSNSELLARRQAAVARGVASATTVFADQADNARLTDVEGRSYIDFVSGIGVVATGHRHPKVMAAVERQMKRFTHTAFQVNMYEPYIELAEKLNALAPFKGPAKSIFFTTGAEAIENAVKIARVATGRQAVIAFSHAFHGRTLLTSTLTGKIHPYKQRAGAPAPEVYRLPCSGGARRRDAAGSERCAGRVVPVGCRADPRGGDDHRVLCRARAASTR